MKKAIMYKNTNYGFLGEKTSTTISGNYLRVGDVIAFEKHDELFVRPVTKKKDGEYGVFGFGSNHFIFKNMTKILSYEFLTEQLLQELQGGRKENFSIKEVEYAKEMTISEVEELLGHKIKIINS